MDTHAVAVAIIQKQEVVLLMAHQNHLVRGTNIVGQAPNDTNQVLNCDDLPP